MTVIVKGHKAEVHRTFAYVVRRERIALSKTLADVAALLSKQNGSVGVAITYLHDIEFGRRKPTSDAMIRAFAEALNLDPHYLFVLAGKVPEDVREMCENRLPSDIIGELFSEFCRGVERYSSMVSKGEKL
jgi:transcriptional regulator with XRE-family HTH domain